MKTQKKKTTLCFTDHTKGMLEKPENAQVKSFLIEHNGRVYTLGCSINKERKDALIRYDTKEQKCKTAEWLTEDIFGFISQVSDYAFVIARPFAKSAPEEEVKKKQTRPRKIRKLIPTEKIAIQTNKRQNRLLQRSRRHSGCSRIQGRKNDHFRWILWCHRKSQKVNS